MNAFCSAAPNQFGVPSNDSAFYVRAVTGNSMNSPSLTSYATYGYQWGASGTSTSANKGIFFLADLNQNWGPYITSVGLFNDDNELLAIAKLSQPIKKPRSFPITIRVELDFD
jgi:hypothetical protein